MKRFLTSFVFLLICLFFISCGDKDVVITEYKGVPITDINCDTFPMEPWVAETVINIYYPVSPGQLVGPSCKQAMVTLGICKPGGPYSSAALNNYYQKRLEQMRAEYASHQDTMVE